MNEHTELLIMTVTASYKGAVGFGELFACQIVTAPDGTNVGQTINLTVLPRDKDKLRLISEHLFPAEIEIGFKMNQKNEPYELSPISGFVDKLKTSWIIEYIREAKY